MPQPPTLVPIPSLICRSPHPTPTCSTSTTQYSSSGVSLANSDSKMRRLQRSQCKCVFIPISLAPACLSTSQRINLHNLFFSHTVLLATSMTIVTSTHSTFLCCFGAFQRLGSCSVHYRMAAKCKNQGPHYPTDVSGLHRAAVGRAGKVLDQPLLQKLSLHRVRRD